MAGCCEFGLASERIIRTGPDLWLAPDGTRRALVLAEADGTDSRAADDDAEDDAEADDEDLDVEQVGRHHFGKGKQIP